MPPKRKGLTRKAKPRFLSNIFKLPKYSLTQFPNCGHKATQLGDQYGHNVHNNYQANNQLDDFVFVHTPFLAVSAPSFYESLLTPSGTHTEATMSSGSCEA